MARYVVQSPHGLRRIDAPSPRAAALLATGTTASTIVWYETPSGWASWSDGPGRRTRHAGKIDERVANLLKEEAG